MVSCVGNLSEYLKTVQSDQYYQLLQGYHACLNQPVQWLLIGSHFFLTLKKLHFRFCRSTQSRYETHRVGFEVESNRPCVLLREISCA